jgi:RNA polymerase sigma-70 factor (ECF subfamily)
MRLGAPWRYLAIEYLYALAARPSGDRTTAEDLVQDALLRAFRGFSRRRNRERPRLWLTRALTSNFHDRIRATRADERVELPGDEHFDLFDDARIIDVLQRLHPSCRMALILAYVYGFKAREIAKMTRKPLGTVLAWLSRGRRQLERQLWDYAVGNRLLKSPQEARV